MAAAGWSGVLRLTDLDDFIAPSQECVKPVVVQKTPGRTLGKITVEEDGALMETDEHGTTRPLQKASITLDDCLACSGCVTTAESVLIQQQSHVEMLRVLRENQALGEASRRLVVVSVSPQARASLAVHYALGLQETASRLTGALKALGVHRVYDTTFSRDFSLLESGREFVERFRRRDGDPAALPMLASACPGWICYAEKTLGSTVLPFISTVRSPQQVMGSLVKDHIARQQGCAPGHVYHVTVMPCYDKKLEASREDFHLREFDTREVDCVITSEEVVRLLEDEVGVSLREAEPAPLDTELSLVDEGGAVLGHDGGGSGGYLEHVFRHAAQELFGATVTDITYRTLRNKDLREVLLESDGRVLLRFAAAYGFRNIQNLVQRLKRAKSPYDYVEVMACPSGCLNGGGQVRTKGVQAGGVAAEELLRRVEEAYASAAPVPPGSGDGAVTRLYREWLGDEGSERAKAALHTSYHALEKPASSLNLKW